MERWAVVACALAVVGVRMARADEDESPSRAAIQLLMPQESAARAKIERALDEQTEFDFDDAPLRKVVDYLGERHHIKIQIAVKALEGANVGPDTPIHCHLRGVSLRAALHWLLGPLGVGFAIQDEALLLTTADEACGILVIQTYYVSDLLEPQMDQPDWPNFAPLIDTIESQVDPVSWEPVGGPGNMMGLGLAHTLVVAQTDKAHVEIAALLGALRQARDEQLREKPDRRPIEVLPAVEIEARAKIRHALDQPADFDFHDRPLTAVVDSLKKQYRIEIQIDRRILKDADVDPDLPITRVLKGGSLRSALQSTLAEYDLEYLIRDEMLVITSKLPDNDQVILTKVYPVGDLVLPRPGGRKMANFMALIEAVESTGGPNGWDETGGMGRLGEFRPSLSLVVAQTDAVHDEIEKLLAGLRRAREVQGVRKER